LTLMTLEQSSMTISSIPVPSDGDDAVTPLVNCGIISSEYVLVVQGTIQWEGPPASSKPFSAMDNCFAEFESLPENLYIRTEMSDNGNTHQDAVDEKGCREDGDECPVSIRRARYSASMASTLKPASTNVHTSSPSIDRLQLMP